MSKIILALESGGSTGSVALRLANGQLTHAVLANGQSHSSGLLPLAQQLLAQQGLSWPDVEGYALGSGPGSFTGLRISCGLIQGLAFAGGQPTIAISGFEAWAYAWWCTHGRPEKTLINIAFDARLNEAYAASLVVQNKSGIDMAWQSAPAVVAIEEAAVNDDHQVLLMDPCEENFEPRLPLAAWVALLAAEPVMSTADRWVPAALLKPLYVRDKVAKTTLERQANPDLQWAAMSSRDIASVMVIEHQAYPFPWTSGNFQDSLNAGYECWVLQEQGVMIGYLVWMRVHDEAHLLNFTLSPARQGRGMGSWMLTWLINQVQAAGLTKIILEVRPSNQKAIGLYTKFKFQVIGTRKGYYPNAVSTDGKPDQQGRREDAIIMQR
jgi:tRNA threonylcarbamoyladenosine biosynthesis protein TsaB